MSDSRCAVHWVGTLPAASVPEAMGLQTQPDSRYALYVGDGEIGRQLWIIPVIRSFASNSALRCIKPGKFRGYWDIPWYALRRGRLLQVDLPYADSAAKSWPHFLELRSQPGNGHLRFQVGIPDPWQIPFFTMLLSQYQVFEDATVEQIRRIHELTGGQATFQLELPAQQVLTYLAGIRPALRARVIEKFTGRLIRLIERCPEGAHLALHWCYGNKDDKPVVKPRSALASVELTNAMVDGWPSGRVLDYVHVPFEYGHARPPSTHPAFYDPLRDLELSGARLAAGFAHLAQPFDVQMWVRAQIERTANLSLPLMISSGCGDGRRSLEAAQLIAAHKRRLAAAS